MAGYAADNSVDFLLLGGGLASVMAADALRSEGADGTIAILSAENTLPYSRTPLTKAYLLGKVAADAFLIRPERFYRDNLIDLRLGRRAVAVMPEDHLVRTDGGDTIRYGKLLIATGCHARALDVAGAALGGIFHLRSRDDADAIRAAAAVAKRALVVVGGSFVGLEVAASLKQNSGFDGDAGRALGPALMPELFAPPLSALFAAQCAAHKVTRCNRRESRAFEGSGARAAPS